MRFGAERTTPKLVGRAWNQANAKSSALQHGDVRSHFAWRVFLLTAD